jgi:hypothetical protein
MLSFSRLLYRNWNSATYNGRYLALILWKASRCSKNLQAVRHLTGKATGGSTRPRANPLFYKASTAGRPKPPLGRPKAATQTTGATEVVATDWSVRVQMS